MEALDALSQRTKNRGHFELRQMQANAGMRPRTKRKLVRRIASHIESVRIWKLAFVPVRRSEKHDGARTCRKRHFIHLVVLRNQAGVSLKWCFHPQNLVNGGGNAG